MDDHFEIPVVYNGKELSLPARLVSAGYITRIEVTVENEVVFFEPDEEGGYRAMFNQLSDMDKSTVAVELLQEIVRVLESVNK